MDRYYRLSGKVPFPGLLLLVVVGGGLSVALGAAYGVGNQYVMYDKLRVLVAVIAGMAIGGILGGLGIVGKVRSMTFMGVVSALAGIAATYAAWVGFFYALTGQQMGISIILLNPADMAEGAAALAEEGYITWGSTTPTGWQLYAIWASEALVLIGLTVGIAMSIMHGRIFCEKCERWVTEKASFEPLALEPVGEHKTSLENRNFSVLKTWPVAADASSGPYLRADVYYCPRCSQLHVLDLVQTSVAAKSKQASQAKLINHLLADSEALTAIQSRTKVESMGDMAPSA